MVHYIPYIQLNIYKYFFYKLLITPKPSFTAPSNDRIFLVYLKSLQRENSTLLENAKRLVKKYFLF